MKHVPLKTIQLKNHQVLNEKWLQDIIAEDPSIIGIGDVILKDKERIHQGAGRLDLLLQDADGIDRYEVEIQLGATDESHIIRTIEYWDIERKSSLSAKRVSSLPFPTLFPGRKEVPL